MELCKWETITTKHKIHPAQHNPSVQKAWHPELIKKISYLHHIAPTSDEVCANTFCLAALAAVMFCCLTFHQHEGKHIDQIQIFWWTHPLSSGAFSLQNQRPWTTGNIPCLEVEIWTERRRHYSSLACFLLIHRKGVIERRLFKTSSVQTVVLVQPILVVGHLNVPPKGNITLASIRLDAQMKNWKLDVRFSSALSQRGPWVWIKWKKGDDASSWNDDLCTRPVYVGNLRTLRNQNITNFTADWKLWHLRSQHTSRGIASKQKKSCNWEASFPHNSPSDDERVTSSLSAHMFWR